MARKVQAFRVIVHGVEHVQYFSGHGLAFSDYEECATGIGDTEQEALFDALELLAQGREDWDLVALQSDPDWISETSSLSAEVPKEIAEIPEGEEQALHVHVSIDVR